VYHFWSYSVKKDFEIFHFFSFFFKIFLDYFLFELLPRALKAAAKSCKVITESILCRRGLLATGAANHKMARIDNLGSLHKITSYGQP